MLSNAPSMNHIGDTGGCEGSRPCPPKIERMKAGESPWQPPAEMKPEQVPLSILREADAVAGQDRSRDYGHPYDNHRRIAEIWSVQLGPILKRPITPREVALCMIGLKLAREVNSPKRDNLVDAAGYIKCVDMIDEAVSKAGNGLQGF